MVSSVSAGNFRRGLPMNRFAHRLFVFAFLLLPALLPLASPVLAQTRQGQWQTLPYTMPINPIHAILLNNIQLVILSVTCYLAGNTMFLTPILYPLAGSFLST